MFRGISGSIGSLFTGLLKNKTTEDEIKKWLTFNGFCGNTAKFDAVELAAIQSPGWLQIFEFSVVVSTAKGEKTQLFGLVKSDDRLHPPLIRVFYTEPEREELFREWSAGLIIRRFRRSKGN